MRGRLDIDQTAKAIKKLYGRFLESCRRQQTLEKVALFGNRV